MPLDPSVPVAVAPAPDTAAEPPAAPETGPTADDTSAVERPSEDTQADTQPTPEDESSAEDDGEDEGADEPEQAEQTEEEKRLSRRERQRLREQERIEREVAERLAAKEREATQAAEQAKREQEAAAAREQAQKKFAEYIGEPDEDSRLQSELADLHRRILAEVAEPKGVDLDDPENGLLAQVAKKETRLAEITKARSFQAEIADSLWNGIQAHMLSPLAFPEFADDPEAKGQYVRAEGGIAGMLRAMREVVRTKALAEKDAEIATLKESHQTALKALEADRNGWRVRAGGSEVADTSAGGQPAGSGAMTRAEFLRLPKEQKDKIRADPAALAAIYERSA